MGHPVTCGKAHPLSEHGWPLTKEGWLEDGYGVTDPLNEVCVDICPPVTVVKSVAKRYAEREIGVYANLRIEDGRFNGETKELRAVFYRSIEPTVEMDFSSGHIGMPVAPPKTWRRYDNWWEGAVLVHVVDEVQHGEKMPLMVPSVVRLQLFLHRPVTDFPAEMESMGGIRIEVDSEGISLVLPKLVLTGIEFISVELGTFKLGSNDSDISGHRHGRPDRG